MVGDYARCCEGDRILVLVMRMGRTVPITISVPTHVPTISDLRIVPPQSNQPTVELQLAAADAAGDLGDAPYVWFTAGCGGEPIFFHASKESLCSASMRKC